MKAAISIPDPVFSEAEDLAKQRGISRSELFTKAVARYIKAERLVRVREPLDEVYKAQPEDSALDPTIETLQSRSLPREKW